MAGVAKYRIEEWMRRRFPPQPKHIHIYECADVMQLLGPGAATNGFASREGMLFASRDQAIPAPRKEFVILTSVLASYSVERIIKSLELHVAPKLNSQPQLRLLVADDLRVVSWGQSSTGADETETEPCEAPPPAKGTSELII